MKARFYSKQAIGILTLILSPFFGSILFSYNLREIGKGKLSPYFIIVGIFWTILFRKLTESFISDTSIQFIFSNAIGSIFLTFFFWDKFFLTYPDYEKKSVWKPTLIFVGVCAALLLFQILASKK